MSGDEGLIPGQENCTEEVIMALCAIRYCIGRRSYIVADGWRWALHYGASNRWLRKIVIQDLEAEFDRARRSNPEYHPLGFESDVAGWRDVLDKLKAIEAVFLEGRI